MAVFIMQKLFFLCTTWREETQLSDIPDVVWHGLKLDFAVSAYVLIIPWLVLMLLPRFGCRQRVLRIYYYIIGALMAVIFVADASLYPFWQFKLDASVFLYTDKPGDALASVSGWYVAMRLVMWAVWMAVLWCVERGARLFAEDDCAADKPRVSIRTISARVAIALVSALVMVLLIRGGVGKGTNNVSAAYYSDSQYLNHCSVNPVFNLIYSFGKQEDFGNEYQYYSEEERQDAIADVYPMACYPLPADTLLNTRTPDVLLIVWEGCCKLMADCIGGRSGITPCLTQIANEGVLFSQCYANSYRTDRGLVCLMAGWLGLPNTSLMKLPQKSDMLPALPRTLLDNGYATTFWYGGDISFTNMGGYMMQAGFSRAISQNDFSKSELTSEWGVPDGPLLSRVADDMLKRKSPTFDAIMTLSSHEAWDVPEKVLEDEVDNAFYYTDKCIGELMARLRKSPRWQNLLVIITADHGVTAADHNRYDEDIIHLPMIWTGGAVRRPCVVDRLMNQSDLAATLLSQMGLDYSKFVFSRDVMSQSYTYPTATYCYNNGVLFADSTGRTIYDNDAQRVIEGEDQRRERKAKATLQTLYKVIDKL